MKANKLNNKIELGKIKHMKTTLKILVAAAVIGVASASLSANAEVRMDSPVGHSFPMVSGPVAAQSVNFNGGYDRCHDRDRDRGHDHHWFRH